MCPCHRLYKIYCLGNNRHYKNHSGLLVFVTQNLLIHRLNRNHCTRRNLCLMSRNMNLFRTRRLYKLSMSYSLSCPKRNICRSYIHNKYLPHCTTNLGNISLTGNLYNWSQKKNPTNTHTHLPCNHNPLQHHE